MTDTQDDEVRWERRIQLRPARGEAAALGELYDRHARLVHAPAARLTGEKKAAEALVTEVFTTLWQHPAAYDPARFRLRTWLAVRTCELAGDRAAGHRAELGDLPRADTALSAMSPGLRTALHLVRTGLRTYREAAAELGITEEEVLSRLRQGLQLIAGRTDVAREDTQ